MRRRRAALLTLLLAGLTTSCGLWLWAQQRQYALNRALIAALVKGDDRRALELVNAGADPNTTYKSLSAPSLPELVNQLLHRSPMSSNDSLTALMMACGAIGQDDEKATFVIDSNRSDDTQLIQAMLTHGAKINQKDERGWTPLVFAVIVCGPNTVRLLLEHGASINTQDKSGGTPLQAAAKFRAPPNMIRLLLENGADANMQDKNGRTALMVAASHFDNSDVVSVLLEHDANINLQNDDGETALYVAVKSDQDKSIIHQLLASGANPNLPDKSGQMPLMLAQVMHRPDLVALLKQYGARDMGKRP